MIDLLMLLDVSSVFSTMRLSLEKLNESNARRWRGDVCKERQIFSAMSHIYYMKRHNILRMFH